MNRAKLASLYAIALLLTLSLPASHTIAADFADPAFQTLWTRTDALVGQNGINRSYFWGPTAGVERLEPYTEGVNGYRLVQYFDKSRMEINNPNADKSSKFYVTNGLLTVELITGKVQVGDSDYQPRYPAHINLASDFDDKNAPTYASFENLMFKAPNRAGEYATSTINRIGNVGDDASKVSDPGTKIVYFEPATKHNIPTVFWNFLNQSGPVIEDGKQLTARLSDPYFYATGYPITEAYWASATIGGQPNTAVLIQPYERRVLTYVPSAPADYQVQMGNIGLHYYDWRYHDAGKPEADLATCTYVPPKGIGQLWSSQPDIKHKLGCAYPNLAYSIQVAQEYFQHGQMIDLIEHTSDGKLYKTIFVLYSDMVYSDGSGMAQRYADYYIDGNDPGGHETPPSDLYAPKYGFGLVWNRGICDEFPVREHLGWATAPETGSNGYSQTFNDGIAIATNYSLNKIYVLYSTNGDGSEGIDRWQVYDDPAAKPLPF